VRIDEAALETSLSTLMHGVENDASIGVLTAGMSRVIGAARQMLHVDGLGVLLVDESQHVRAVAADGPLSAALESAQEELGVGPGIDVLSTGQPVAVTDLPEVHRYGKLWCALEGTGVRAILSVPIRVSGRVTGNLSALDAEPHTWSAEELTAARAFADVVSTLLGLGSVMFTGPGPRSDDG
jgi:GAF domain-containing protein